MRLKILQDHILKDLKKVNKLPVIKKSIILFLVLLQLSTILGVSYVFGANLFPAKSVLNLDYSHDVLLTKATLEEVQEALAIEPILAEQERIERERDAKIERLLNFLKKQKSPVATREYASQIIDLADANNADFRIIVAIMGVESGFCRVPVKKNGNTFNCFGYLNGVKYASFEDAFNNLIPKIAVQYANKYGWDFVSLAKAYGQHSWEKTSKYMYNWASSI